jgi:hypothetical protein
MNCRGFDLQNHSLVSTLHADGGRTRTKGDKTFANVGRSDSGACSIDEALACLKQVNKRTYFSFGYYDQSAV